MQCMRPRKDGWIGLLYVEPEQRRSGIGRALLDEMKRYFQSKNCDTLRLKVLSSNQRAITFYEKYDLTAREVEIITKTTVGFLGSRLEAAPQS